MKYNIFVCSKIHRKHKYRVCEERVRKGTKIKSSSIKIKYLQELELEYDFRAQFGSYACVVSGRLCDSQCQIAERSSTHYSFRLLSHTLALKLKSYYDKIDIVTRGCFLITDY